MSRYRYLLFPCLLAAVLLVVAVAENDHSGIQRRAEIRDVTDVHKDLFP